MNGSPTVSVVIPTYNRGRLLSQTLDSVLAQTYRPIEVVVVDDGSTDGAGQVVEEWARAHSNGVSDLSVRCCFQVHSGSAAARNRGLAEAKGSYIQFFDSDDIMFPENLAAKAAILQKEAAVDFVACDYSRFVDDPRNAVETVCLSSADHTLVNHVLYCVLTTHAPLYRRAALERVGPWEESLTRWDDLEFASRVITEKLNGIWLDRVLYAVRDHGDSLTRMESPALWDSALRACRFIEKTAESHGLSNKAFRDAMGRRLINLAYELAMLGEAGRARAIFREAWGGLSVGSKLIHGVYSACARLAGHRRMRRVASVIFMRMGMGVARKA